MKLRMVAPFKETAKQAIDPPGSVDSVGDLHDATHLSISRLFRYKN